ncbi:MAG: phosphate ABC transporter permease subunit PstC, partial [Spirochaetia bacterium]|nr:phosphate ABC transporter permease subunit PstC [Spirochaetia bacterium]
AISMGRTLTMNIITDMSYAEGTHMSALFATAILLFAFILVLNLIVVSVSRKSRLEGTR